MFQLTADEAEILRSQIVTSAFLAFSPGGRDILTPMKTDIGTIKIRTLTAGNSVSGKGEPALFLREDSLGSFYFHSPSRPLGTKQPSFHTFMSGRFSIAE